MKAFRIVGSVFFFIGLVFIVVGGIFYYNTHTFLARSEATTGKVVRLIQGYSQSSNGGSSVLFYPVVRFETQTGDIIDFQSRIGSRPAHRIGDIVRVRYLKEDPHQARIDTFFQLWFLSLLFGGLGFFFGMAGSLMLLAVFRAVRREK